MSSLHTDRQTTHIRQAEIIAAVLALAAEHGPAALSTPRIAHSVGLTDGALFKHFPTKAALWLAVIDWVDAQLLTRLQRAADAAPEPLAALRAVFLAHVDFAIAHPGVPRFIFNELQHPDDSPVKARVRAMLGRYRSVLNRLLDALPLPAAERDAAATLFIGSVQGLVMQAMAAGDMPGMRGAAEAVFDLYRRALAAGSAS